MGAPPKAPIFYCTKSFMAQEICFKIIAVR